MSESVAPSAFGRYELLGRVGKGGMCEIHRARLLGPAGFERHLAIKFLHDRYRDNAEMVQTLCEEARVGATLVHPNVVQVFDFGLQDGIFYIVLEFVDGIDLDEVFRHMRALGHSLPITTTLTIMAQVLSGLESAHRRRDSHGGLRPVVHRDVSPGNVMLRSDGWVKITDFGLARPLDRMRRTSPGVVKGKFSYLTPEQTVDLPVDARSDLFQVGIVLWETLTGRSLFRRENEYETLLAVREAPIPSPSELSADVPPEVDAIVHKALSRDPEDRFQDAIVFRRAIEAVLRAHDLGVEPYRIAHLVAEVRGARDLRQDRPNETGLVPWTERPPAPMPDGPIASARVAIHDK